MPAPAQKLQSREMLTRQAAEYRQEAEKEKANGEFEFAFLLFDKAEKLEAILEVL